MIDPSLSLTWLQCVSALWTLLLVATTATLLLGGKALWDFTRMGPQLPDSVIRRYAPYAILSFVRLCSWWFLIQLFIGLLGLLCYLAALIALNLPYHPLAAAAAEGTAILVVVGLRFSQLLLYLPSSIVMSFQYHPARLYGLWRRLSEGRLRIAGRLLAGTAALLVGGALVRLAALGAWPAFALLAGLATLVAAVIVWDGRVIEPQPARAPAADPERPNVLMIGCDTLRVDRLGAMGYHRALTPFIDSLVAQGTLLCNCYTPLARTAPSLASLLTGLWPHSHGFRSNFVSDDEAKRRHPTLGSILQDRGYRTQVIADWAGADFGKIDLGFEQRDVPDDQWNIKLYLKQGPIDLRLIVSLFCHGRFGRRFLPEIYYLPSSPLNDDMGRDTRAAISRLAAQGQPFLLNLFIATAHVPFGTEYPYYERFTPPDYWGNSKFSMVNLATPSEIVEQQEAPAVSFDIPQILNLYDNCVYRFDEEVRRIVTHLRDCGLADNTIVVVYSDHGSDFFEQGSWGQGNTFSCSDPSARVPMVILDPRHPGGGKVDAISRTIDLMPTLLDLLGVAAPDRLDGRSLAAFIRAEPPPPPLPAFQETGVWLGRIPGMVENHLTYPNILHLLEIRDYRSGTLCLKQALVATILQAKDRMIRDGRWKLVYQPLIDGARFELFDLEAATDPCADVADKYPDKVDELKQRLIAWMCEDPGMEWDGRHMVLRDAGEAVERGRE